MLNTVYLLIGGNLGKREEMLQTARGYLSSWLGQWLQGSAVYETEPWGPIPQPAYLNQAIAIATPYQPFQLLRICQHIEKLMGRQRQQPYGPRTMDIDILLFANQIINHPQLQIPHPQMANRRFVLQPLADIAPHLVHPAFGLTIAQMLAQCPDTLHVKKFSPM